MNGGLASNSKRTLDIDRFSARQVDERARRVGIPGGKEQCLAVGAPGNLAREGSVRLQLVLSCQRNRQRRSTSPRR